MGLGIPIAWRHHQMETFSASLAFCAVNSPVPGEFHSQRPVTWSFDIFFDLCLNKRLSKRSWGCWFETPSYSLWCHCNENWKLYCPVAPDGVITKFVGVFCWTRDSDALSEILCLILLLCCVKDTFRSRKASLPCVILGMYVCTHMYIYIYCLLYILCFDLCAQVRLFFTFPPFMSP